jgi:hypothetical protein
MGGEPADHASAAIAERTGVAAAERAGAAGAVELRTRQRRRGEQRRQRDGYAM